MTKQRTILTIALLGFAAASVGCELIASVNRDQIPVDGGSLGTGGTPAPDGASEDATEAADDGGVDNEAGAPDASEGGIPDDASDALEDQALQDQLATDADADSADAGADAAVDAPSPDANDASVDGAVQDATDAATSNADASG